MKEFIKNRFTKNILVITVSGILSIVSLATSNAWTTALLATATSFSLSSNAYADKPKKPKTKRLQRCPGYPKTRNTPGTYGAVSGLYNGYFCKHVVSGNLMCSSIARGCHDTGAPQPGGGSSTSKKVCLCPPVGFKTK